jgi:hypothetical protein
MNSDADEAVRLARQLGRPELYEQHLRNRIVAIRDELAAGTTHRVRCHSATPR